MKATIDRIEGPVAVLILCEEESVQVNLPVSLLPPGCREGDILLIRIERDRVATEAAQERVSGLIEKLKNESKER
ncbi:MAG: DUF3006 domain-containing protein [Methanoregula sp.]|nr:DUF3006 domain-containing protein [Methanoregula sp.]